MNIYTGESTLDAARARFRWLYQEFENVLVAMSGGKDSTVCLNLAIEAAELLGRLPVNVVTIDQEAEWQGTADYVRDVMYDSRVKPYWYQVPMTISNASSEEEDFLYAWREGDAWMREKDPIAIHASSFGVLDLKEMFPAIQYEIFGDAPSIVIGGVRADESPNRRLGLTGVACYKWITWGKNMPVGSNRYGFYPIYDWRYRDVWKAIHEFDWSYNCNTGDALIWMGDFSFKRIDQVNPGDEVIGFTFDRGFSKRDTLVRTTVKAVGSREADVVKITMASGRVLRCTADHRWVCRARNNASVTWEYRPAAVGDAIAFVVEPEETAPITKEGAWLGGIYDGEGHGDSIIQSMDHNPEVCHEIERAFSLIDVPYGVSTRGKNIRAYRIAGTGKGSVGGRQSKVRFLNRTLPIKSERLSSMILTSRFRTPDEVVSIEPDGTDMVYAMETGTHNYVARGYASSNSVYDKMYQYGVPPREMRISSVHHELALNALSQLPEFEPETWSKVIERIKGSHIAAHAFETYKAPKELPWMFGSWREYRDYLLDKMVLDPRKHELFASQFRAHDPRYTGALARDLHWQQCTQILKNDHWGVTTKNWLTVHPPVYRKMRDRWGLARDKAIVEARSAQDVL